MVFKKCSIDGVLFKDQDGILLCENEDYNERSVRKFLEVLSLCHTVQVAPKIPTNSTKNVTLDVDDPYDLVYNASSPDEKAIVEACRQYGVAYLGESEVRIFKGPKHLQRRSLSNQKWKFCIFGLYLNGTFP